MKDRIGALLQSGEVDKADFTIMVTGDAPIAACSLQDAEVDAVRSQVGMPYAMNQL